MAQTEYARERLWDAHRDSMVEDDLARIVEAAPENLNAHVSYGSDIFCTLPADWTIKEIAEVWIGLMRGLPGYKRRDGLHESSGKDRVTICYDTPYAGRYATHYPAKIFIGIPEVGVCRRVQVGTRMSTESVEVTPAEEEDREVEVPVYEIVCDGDDAAENVA